MKRLFRFASCGESSSKTITTLSSSSNCPPTVSLTAVKSTYCCRDILGKGDGGACLSDGGVETVENVTVGVVFAECATSTAVQPITEIARIANAVLICLSYPALPSARVKFHATVSGACFRPSFRPWNDGAYHLTGSPSGATCRPTTKSPDITLSVDNLAVPYLGGSSIHPASPRRPRRRTHH